MATFPVVIDACVLFNAPVRDTLLRAAEHGLYRVHWSQTILDETTKNLVERGKMTQEKAQYLVSEMAKAFPEALVVVPESRFRRCGTIQKIGTLPRAQFVRQLK